MSLNGLRVLVVEDEALVAMEIEAVVADLGCAVVGPVANLRDALRLIEEQDLDGALIDINLQGEHAYPAAEALLARGVPFVFLTGYSGLPAPPAALQGAPEVRKPFAPRALAATVRQVIGGETG